MPFSSGAGKVFIRDVLARLKPKKVLDIGVGKGSILKRYKTNGQKWTGVEVWQPYVDTFKLDELYDELIVGDARELDFGEDKYDVAFAGDVLEHMTYEEAQRLMAKLQRAAYHVIISIPMGNYPQGPYEGNPYETHVTNHWTPTEVAHQFGTPTEYKVTDPVGTFVYSRQPKPDKKLKIAVYCISKNEEQFVRRCIESAKDADMFILADTGSTDRTVEIAKECGATVHHIHISPWRFDLARNASMALIPADVDICVNIDLDEVLEPGWREEFERLWQPGVTRLRYGFDWGHGIVFAYEKTHARSGYRWHHPCHEYPVPDGRIVERVATTDKVLVKHYPDPEKSRAYYMDLLELSVKEDPHCPRNAFYYARELTFNGREREAIDALHKYLAMPNTWINERCYAMRLLGKCYDAIQDSGQAWHWYVKATAEAPFTREPWLDLATAAYGRHDWVTVLYATTKGLEIKNRAQVYTCDPAAWGFRLHDLRALALYHQGRFDEAVVEGEAALAHSPQDVRLLSNLDYYRKALQPEPVSAKE